MDDQNNSKQNGSATPTDTKKVHLRRSHKKSHLGCKKCKQRRIKCDEQLPICGQCKRGNIDCPYLHFSEKETQEHMEKREKAAKAAVAVPPPSAVTTEATTVADSTNTSKKRTPLEHAPITKQIATLPQLERRDISTTVSITRSGFETDTMRWAYHNWMQNTLALAYHHPCLFHSTMAFAFSFSHIKTKNEAERSSSDRHRFIALREIQNELQSITPANTDALLSSSLILSWDVFLQGANITSYITLSRGLGAVLEKVQRLCSTTQMALCMTESLFQSIKTILHPPYDPTFFSELISQITAAGEFILETDDKTLSEEHQYLQNYVSRFNEFLITSPRDSKASMFLRDPRVIYDFMREWLSNFPCNALNLEMVTNDNALVLYSFFHAVTRAMDALLPEARYLFQFSFIGPIDLANPENCMSYTNDDSTKDRLAYPLSIISFFKKRQFVLNQIFINTDPLKYSQSGVPVYRMPLVEPVKETFVTSFLNLQDTGLYMPYVSERMFSPTGSTSSSSGASTAVPSPTSSTSDSSPVSIPPTVRRESNATVTVPEDLPLSSMSMGMFRSYFVDRMAILEKFTNK